MLREKVLATSQELRSKVKAEEIVKAVKIKKGKKLSFKKKRDYEIVEIQQLENGVALFARVFENGEQIGFGDGTVDIERFIFINPPLLVDDENGDIVDTFTDKEGVTHTQKFREDPEEAIKQALENTVDTMKNKFDASRIVSGKIGNTTTTVYSSTADGSIRVSNANFTTARNAASGTALTGNTTAYLEVLYTGSVYEIYPLWFMFDTSAISSSDTISAASLSFYLNGDNSGTASNQWVITQSAQTTWNSLVGGDYSRRSDAPTGTPTLGATGVNRVVTAATTGYQTISLDSTGMGWISRSGETKPATASATGKTQLCLDMSADTSNSAPTTSDYNQVRMADQAGTSSDPYLTMEHAAAVTFTPQAMWFM